MIQWLYLSKELVLVVELRQEFVVSSSSHTPHNVGGQTQCQLSLECLEDEGCRCLLQLPLIVIIEVHLPAFVAGFHEPQWTNRVDEESSIEPLDAAVSSHDFVNKYR